MAELVDFRYKVRKFYKFTPNEIKGLVIAITVLAFVISFRQWGEDSFDLGEGLFNFFNAFLIVALSLLVHDAGKRLWGLAIGYRTEFQFWGYGLIISVLLAFLTRGHVWLLVPGGFMIHHLAGHRLGWFRYGINYFGQAMVALGGNLFTLSLIIMLKILYAVSGSDLVHNAVIFNVVFLITNMAPIPPMDGSKIYFGSRMTYMFVMPAIVAAAILMIIDIPIFLAIVLSLLIGVILWIVYYIGFERKVWRGPQ